MNNDLISRSALLEQVRFTLPIDSERRRILADCVGIMRGLIIDAPAVDAVEMVRCKDCDVPHNKWTGCPNLNGMIPPADFYCARGERRRTDD
jgi:hypothetical protein